MHNKYDKQIFETYSFLNRHSQGSLKAEQDMLHD